MAAGWNWISINAVTDSAQLGNILGPLGEGAKYITSQSGSSTNYSDSSGWYGSLTELDVREMYMLQMEWDAELVVTGMAVDVASTPISVVNGWNWIGYLPQGPLGVDEALSSVSDSAAYITSQYDGFTTNYGDYGWYGSLTSMNAGRGYMLKMHDGADLVYPSADTTYSRLVSTDNTLNVPQTISDWSVNYADYQHVGSITASIENRGDFAGDMVAVFVDDKCRGVAERMYFPPDDRYYYLIQVYSNVDGEALTFKYYNSNTDDVVEYSETVPFTSNMIVGDGFSPLGLSAEKGNTLVPDEYSISNAYPNPFNPTTEFTYSMPEEGMVNISVYDISGRLVVEIVNGWKNAGVYPGIWNAQDIASGIYMINISINEFHDIQKIMLVK